MATPPVVSTLRKPTAASPALPAPGGPSSGVSTGPFIPTPSLPVQKFEPQPPSVATPAGPATGSAANQAQALAPAGAKSPHQAPASMNEHQQLIKLRLQAKASGTPWDPNAALAKLRGGTAAAGAPGAAPGVATAPPPPPPVAAPPGLTPANQAQALMPPQQPTSFWT